MDRRRQRCHAPWGGVEAIRKAGPSSEASPSSPLLLEGQRGHQAEAQPGVVPDCHRGCLGPGTSQHTRLLWAEDCAVPPLAAETLGCTQWGGGQLGSRGRPSWLIPGPGTESPVDCSSSEELAPHRLSVHLPAGSSSHICVCSVNSSPLQESPRTCPQAGADTLWPRDPFVLPLGPRAQFRSPCSPARPDGRVINSHDSPASQRVVSLGSRSQDKSPRRPHSYPHFTDRGGEAGCREVTSQWSSVAESGDGPQNSHPETVCPFPRALDTGCWGSGDCTQESQMSAEEGG